MKRGALFSLLMLISSAALSAQGSSITLQTSSFYLGGGLGFNSHLGGRSVGYQILGGYEFAGRLNGDISTAIELGYMDTDNFETKNLNNGATSTSNQEAIGVWLNVVETFPIGKRVEGIARLGLDFGDDDGIMVGAGMAYNFNRNWALRSEYVIREAVDSFQFNLLYGF
jgi:opacity protein-like surface antigen